MRFWTHNPAQALSEVSAFWVYVDVQSVTGMAPGKSLDVTVTFNADALAPGRYESEIVITSNDRDHPTMVVPLVLTVVRTQPYVFYNHSAWDGNDPSANLADDAAIAIDKEALRTGHKASFANYTSYSLGINGVIVDLPTLPGPTPGVFPLTADFTFRMGNSDTPMNWPSAPSPQITIRRRAGLSGGDRVTLVWPDGAIKKQWLQVTVLATSHTGLDTPDVFYFGNAVGETGNSAAAPLADAVVNVTDTILTRSNQRGPFNPAPITFPYDYNRDKLVNSTDTILGRANQAGPFIALKLITPP